MLLKKLDTYVIYGVEKNLIKRFFFLNNRNQRVKTNNVHSNYNTLNYGVIQGTVLGPLLIIVYINDLLEIKREVPFSVFADDNTILIKDLNKTKLINKKIQFV